MRTLDNRLVISQGESFTLCREIVNPDGSPYIVSSLLQNPRWIITIASDTYSQAGRYVKQFELSINNELTPTYSLSKALDIKKILTAQGGASKFTNGFASIVSDTESIDGYYDGLGTISGEAGEVVFYEEDVDTGARIYQYIKGNIWRPYKCLLICAFTHDETAKWVDKTYSYSISLVGEYEEEIQSIPILQPTKIYVNNILEEEETI